MSYAPPQYRCPYCGSPQRPHTLQKISTGGWIVFAVMLLVCFPLFFIGLLMKDTYQVCGQCGLRLNYLDIKVVSTVGNQIIKPSLVTCAK